MHNALLNTERKSKSCTINADAEIMSEAVSLQAKYTSCKMAKLRVEKSISRSLVVATS